MRYVATNVVSAVVSALAGFTVGMYAARCQHRRIVKSVLKQEPPMCAPRLAFSIVISAAILGSAIYATDSVALTNMAGGNMQFVMLYPLLYFGEFLLGFGGAALHLWRRRKKIKPEELDAVAP